MPRPATRLEIELEAIHHNFRVLRDRTGPGVRLCAVVKADAYGLGVASVAPTLVAAGTDAFATYTLAQADGLLDVVGAVRPILVLGSVREIPTTPRLRAAHAAGRLELTLHDTEQFEAFAASARAAGGTWRVHVHVDTGMHRGGCPPAEAARLLTRIAATPSLRLVGIGTHFASAEDDPRMTAAQAARFAALLTSAADRIPLDCVVHAANTAATLRSDDLHFGMVRIGHAWIGHGPPGLADALRPAVRWVSTIVQTKMIARGARVGYGQTWTAPRATRLGLVPVGYADGYPAALGNVGRFVIPDAGIAPVVGRVNMDQCSIDLTDLPPTVGVGTEVEVVGTDPKAVHHLPVLARQAGTVPYEMLCRLTPRLPRICIGDAPSVRIVSVPVPPPAAFEKT